MKKTYLGKGSFVRDTDIIGIFDMDSITISKSSREFLEIAEETDKVVYSNLYEFPRSVVLTDDKIFITTFSALTVSRRIEKNLF